VIDSTCIGVLKLLVINGDETLKARRIFMRLD
jgi:hypothetical protein